MPRLIALWLRVPRLRRLLGVLYRPRPSDFDAMTAAEWETFIELSGLGAATRAAQAELHRGRTDDAGRIEPGLRATQGGSEEPRGAPVA
jgi:hypothetical protein